MASMIVKVFPSLPRRRRRCSRPWTKGELTNHPNQVVKERFIQLSADRPIHYNYNTADARLYRKKQNFSRGKLCTTFANCK